MKRELTQSVVEEWVALTDGQFTTQGMWTELNIQSPESKHYLRTVLRRLADKGIVAPIGRDGTYRRIDNDAKVMNWQAADPKNVVPLKFPFGIEQYARIYPKSIIIVAGSKNAGKTAFVYNFVVMNMKSFTVDLFNSETGPEQMNERFAPFDIPNPAPFNVYERQDNFADVVHPDHISVIDYLDLDSEVYMVGAEINNIFKKLNSGVAVIALQKPPPTVTFIHGVKKVIDRDLAYGGGFTAKRAVLYITMGSSKLKLLYVKTPAQKGLNPDNMSWNYYLDDDGAKFCGISRYYGEEPEY